jgi:hypothetical protein
MCGVSLKDKRRSEDLLKLIGISSIEEIMDKSALRWLTHVERKEELDWVSCCRRVEVDGEAYRGRKMYTWGGRMDRVMKKKGMRVNMAVDRDAWRSGGAPSRPTRLGVQTRASR